MSLLAVIPLVLFASASPPIQDQGYMGAQTALTELSKKAPKTGQSISERAAALAKTVATMPPSEAATAWHALFMESLDESGSMSYDGGSNNVFVALPPPTAWSAIASKFEAMQPDANKRSVRQHALALLGHLLGDNKEAQWKDIAGIQIGLGKADGETRATYILSTVNSLYQSLAVMNVDRERILKSIERSLSQPQAASIDSEMEYGGLQIPDLVTLFGEEKAAEVIKKVLTTYPKQVSFTGGQTRKLAKAIALANIATLKAAPWDLTEEIGEVKLYEALIKKFPPKDATAERQLVGAKAYYVMSLVMAGRSVEAAKVLAATKDASFGASLGYAIAQIRNWDSGDNLWSFFHTALAKDPKLPYWTPYIYLSTAIGKQDEMMSLLAEVNKRPNLGKLSTEIKTYYASALLAVGKVEEGISELKAIAASDKQSEGYSKALALQNLGELGLLLKRPELTNIAITAGLQAARKDQSSPPNLLSMMFRSGRGPEAERFIVEQIQKMGAEEASYYGGYGATGSIYDLLALYYAAGRAEDIAYVVDNYKSWPVRDAKMLLSQTVSDLTKPAVAEHSASTAIPVPYIIAYGLAKTGKPERAIPILEAVLATTPGFDGAYDLYTEIRGEAAIPTLDRIYSLDQFEERPLIWKAAVLFKAGKIDEAETVAKAAIAVDPSDGEQGKGDRMRVYAVYADILEKKGNVDQASIFRNAVRAIRASEEADDYMAVGLISESIERYEKSLELFADAYCIQSRLAIQLASQGRFDEAEEHYRKAYELMPDSFGRVESHCFGCEAAFAGEDAQAIAEEVFQRLLKSTPNKPQVHYLMGYLRETQGRESEALIHYKDAVRLDPDYINAWNRIVGLSARLPMTQTEVEAATAALLRLDPLARHREASSSDENYSLRQTYEAGARAYAITSSLVPDSIFPLSIAKAYEDPMMERMMDMSSGSGVTVKSPGEAVADHRVVAQLLRLLAMLESVDADSAS